MGRERRRRSRRNSGQRAMPPGMPGAAMPGMEPLDEPVAAPEVRAARTPRAAPVQVRSDRLMERETATMISEMKRVGIVSAVCFGMLAVLVVVERMQ